MANNITLNEQTNTAGAILWTEELTGPKHAQIMKLADGSAGATTMIVAGNGAAASAMRVTLASDGTGVLAQLGNISATVNVVVGAGTSNIGIVNNISATVAAVLGAGSANIGSVNDISATVNVVVGAGSANIGSINNISATVSAVLGAGSANIGFINNISATVAVVTGTTFAVQEDGSALSALETIAAVDFATQTTLATIDTDTGNIATNTTDLPNVIGTDGGVGPSKTVSVGGTESGGNIQEVRVDADGHLQVDVLSGGGAGTEYTEDAAAAANPVGGASILVRQDTPAALTTTDGDNVAQRGTNFGAGFVQVVDSSGNFIDTFGGSGGTASTDDAAFTAGSGQGTPAMGFFSSDTVDAGDVGVLAMDASRRLLCSIEVDNVGIGGGTQYTEDAAAAANPVGNAMMLVREDARAGSLTSTDGDNVALRGNNKGEAYVIDTDANALLTTIDADTNAIKTAVETIDNAVSGSGLNITQLNGVNVTMNNGVVGTGVQRVTIASDSTGVLAQIGNISASVNVVIGSGSTLNGLGKIDGISATANVVIGTGTAEIGSIASISATVATSLAPVSVSRQIDLDESEDSINSAASTLYFIHAMNLTAAVAYLHLYDSTTATVNVGTTTPTMTFPLPTQGDTNGAGFVLSIDRGITFSTGIIAAVTTGITGSAGPAANTVMATFGYL